MSRLKYFILALLLFILMITGSVMAAEIMPLKNLQPGMHGYAKTVFYGTKIEKFSVEIISIMKNRGLESDMILIKTGGPLIEETGGIAAGMSGSPVYIDDKLIGAIGYGWQDSDHRYGLVTPIEEMLPLLDDNKDGELVESQIDLADSLARTNTPLMVSGLQGRALKRFEEEMQKIGLDVKPSSGIKKEDTSETWPEPGDAIAVQLVRGDINVASIGTLTYLKGNQLLAFGHPFRNVGEVDYLLSKAYIDGVIPSQTQPFKLGAPFNKLIGAITTDRGAGIAGQLQKFPRIIPLHIRIKDESSGRVEEVAVQIVNDENLLTSMANNVALQAVDSTLDRIGSGTAQMEVKIMGNGLPDLEMKDANMYYSLNDIGSMALVDFYSILDLITRNPFKKVNIIDIRLDLTFNQKDQVALVEEAKILNEEVWPGDIVEVEVTLHPYRADTFKKVIKLNLPEDINPGLATLFIDGGSTGQYSQTTIEAEPDMSDNINQAQISGHTSLAEMIEGYQKQPNNNELLLQLYQAYSGPPLTESSAEPPTPDPEENKVKKEKPNQQPEQKQEQEDNKAEQDDAEEPAENEYEADVKEVITTDYVLEGNLSLDLEIMTDEEETPAEEAENESREQLKYPNKHEVDNRKL